MDTASTHASVSPELHPTSHFSDINRDSNEGSTVSRQEEDNLQDLYSNKDDNHISLRRRLKDESHSFFKRRRSSIPPARTDFTVHHRHALLKSNSKRYPSAKEKDSPAPPILTNEKMDAEIPFNPADDERHVIPSIPLESSEAVVREMNLNNKALAETPSPSRPCFDPSFHLQSYHNLYHHAGLLKGADFCDAGLPTEREREVGSPIPSPPRSPTPTIEWGTTHRVRDDGEISEREVDVTAHRHQDHPSTVKVRPFFQQVYGDDRHKGHQGASKVQPVYDIGPSQQTIYIGQGEVPTEQVPMEQPDHLHDGHENVSKVGPILYDADSATTNQRNEGSIPQTSNEQEDHLDLEGVQEDPEATSYWGFIPKFIRGDHDDHLQTKAGAQSGSVINSPNSKAATTPQHLSQASRHPSHETIWDFDHQSDLEMDTKDHHALNSQAISPTHSLTAESNQRKDQCSPPPSRARSYNSSQVSLPHNGQEELRKASGRILPETWDPLRTAQWIREVFGFGDDEAKLTKLPKKGKLRQEPGEGSSIVSNRPIETRVTTWSGKNAADAGAMDAAMRNMEDLLGEALQIAEYVAQQEVCEHGKEGTQGSTIHVDNDCAHGLNSEDHLAGLAGSSAFVGAPEGSSHGCEALPLRSIHRRKPLKPDIANGHVRGPALSKRKSSLKALRPHRKHKHKPKATELSPHHDLHDNCMLPMPPPDRQIKRDRPSTLPHAYSEDDVRGVIKPHGQRDVPNTREVREYIRVFHEPPVAARQSSRNPLTAEPVPSRKPAPEKKVTGFRRRKADVCGFDGGSSDDVIDFETQYGGHTAQAAQSISPSPDTHSAAHHVPSQKARQHRHKRQADVPMRHVSLHKRSHVSLRPDQRFSLIKSVKRQPIARDWSVVRKRMVAGAACASTALIGVLVGIYAGLVPSIQYMIADFHHYAIIGNAALYVGMALPTLLLWPLPLLHGRKPYIVCSLGIAMPLIFPQAIAVSIPRSPHTSVWRWALLASRGLMGFALGFTSMNTHAILTDLFGASLMSSKPHQEVVDCHDVRRHGGGLGVWLGIWTWCFIGSLGVGFLIGAAVIDHWRPSWGLYISIACIGVVLVLNILCPEVRRSPWRRSVAEVRTNTELSRRVARGEVMMHRVKNGPKWWGQEMYHGLALCFEMLRQPGFFIMAIYSAWIYAQVVLIIVLLGSLASRSYRLRSTHVGAAVSSVAIGAALAIPFQKANIFSRARYRPQRTNTMTLDNSVAWTSHLVRRIFFVVGLPVAGAAYTVVSYGPPMHLAVPCLFAAMIGFLSCLGLAECHGLVMETWDTSDLHPGMTGRSKSEKDRDKRTNYSSFPRVNAGFAVMHGLGFLLAGAATGVGGIAQRRLGQEAATGVVAGILLVLSLLMLATLVRFKNVAVIPRSSTLLMDEWTKERRAAGAKIKKGRQASKLPADVVGWRPLILGNPTQKYRRMNILELGSMTRWSEIRKRNRLIDDGTHLNRQTIVLARDEMERRGNEIMDEIHRTGHRFGGLARKVSRKSMRSLRSHHSQTKETSDVKDQTERGSVDTDYFESTRCSSGGNGQNGHRHTPVTPGTHGESECVIHQAVPEEGEEYTSIDGGSDDDYTRRRGQGAFELQQVRGGRVGSGDFVVEVASQCRQQQASLSETHSGDSHEFSHRQSQRSHRREHVHESKVRGADMEFVDVDLNAEG